MCHSEQGLGLIPNRPESGEFDDPPSSPVVAKMRRDLALVMDAEKSAKAEARFLADIKAADTADLKHSILGMVDLLGPTDAREVRLLAAELVREMQRTRGLRLDMAGQIRWFKRFRDLVAELFLPAPQAEMIRASLTVSEMQGLDLEAPKPEPEAEETPSDRECPNCGGTVSYRVRGEDLGWDCDNCGRRHAR